MIFDFNEVGIILENSVNQLSVEHPFIFFMLQFAIVISICMWATLMLIEAIRIAIETLRN